MALTRDEELFRCSCTQLDNFSPTQSKAVCDAHGQLQTAKTKDGYGLGRLLKQIQTIYGMLIQEVGIKMIVPKRRSSEIEEFPFFFYVDNIKNSLSNSEESLHFHICANLGKGWIILRETAFNVSPLALFPYHYEYTSEEDGVTSKYHIGLKLTIPEISSTEYASKEATLDYLTKIDSLKLKCTFSNIPFDSQWSDGQYRKESVCVAEFEPIDVPIIDDYGRAYSHFNESSELNSEELPEYFTDKTLTLIDKDEYAPLTTKDYIYCLIYAEKKNKVRVLRWLPTTMEDMKTKPLLPLHELGDIAAEETEELYNEMTNSNNTLLFAKASENTLKVICNMNEYSNSELKEFVLPEDLFNLAK